MKPLPTDLQILNAIYDRYYDDFAAWNEDNPPRTAKTYVPIDTSKIASELTVEPDIVFGRLYYHLNQKPRYRQEHGHLVELFSLSIQQGEECVNFPLMASVLADLRDQKRKHQVATWIAFLSLAIAIASILISLFGPIAGGQ